MTIAWNHPSITECFDTFEGREAAFNLAVGRLLPIRYKGPDYFWRDFRRITHGPALSPNQLPAFITSNPRDCLAFGSPIQVLTAARATAQGQSPAATGDIEAMTRSFGLEQVLYQPIRTLSGGETVRLALAKAMMAAAHCDQLVIASPFCWMAATHLPLLSLVTDAFAQAGKSVRILSMTDEASQQPMSRLWLAQVNLQPLDFVIACRRCRISLGTPINAITAEPAFALVQDIDVRLSSPCLLVGDNGQGKSLLAKALSGAMVVEGSVAVRSKQGRQARVRLLFQDVITQTLMRTLPDIARGGSADQAEITDLLFGELLAIFGQIMAGGTQQADLSARHALDGSITMIAVKAMLIAARLVHQPAALILDEPDWGLSRASAMALVLSVVQKAHSLGIPVIIISHKPWWRPLAADTLVVTRKPAGDGPHRFTIHVECGAPIL